VVVHNKKFVGHRNGTVRHNSARDHRYDTRDVQVLVVGIVVVAVVVVVVDDDVTEEVDDCCDYCH